MKTHVISLDKIAPLLAPAMPDGFTVEPDLVADVMFMRYGERKWLLFTRQEFENNAYKAEFEKRITKAICEIWGFDEPEWGP